MRSAQDIVQLTVRTERILQLDLERVQKDPVWRQIYEQMHAQDPDVPITEVVKSYAKHYIVRDLFPHRMPATNGPGDLTAIHLEAQ